MDQDRQIRFLIPPIIFFLSLFIGIKFDESLVFKDIVSFSSTFNIFSIIIAGAASIVSLGFIISLVSICFIRFGFFIFRKQSYEAVLSIPTQKEIWNSLKLDSKYEFNSELILYNSSTFCYDTLPKGIQVWLMRRWSSFNISIHSIFAIIISFSLANLFGVNQSCCWFVYCIVLISLLGINAYFSWHETMNMIDFQSHRIDEILKQKGIEINQNKNENR